MKDGIMGAFSEYSGNSAEKVSLKKSFTQKYKSPAAQYCGGLSRPKYDSIVFWPIIQICHSNFLPLDMDRVKKTGGVR